MSPLWNRNVNFKLGVNAEYHGTVRYHGPILAMKFKQSICFYLHCVDEDGNSVFDGETNNSVLECFCFLL